MYPLYRDPHFRFHFVEPRCIRRIHLEGVARGSPVSVYRIDPNEPATRLGLLATAEVGEDGWVDLDPPIIVRAGDAFVAVPQEV